MYATERDEALFKARVLVPRKTKAGDLAKIPSVFYRCAACGELFKDRDIQVDHITPIGYFPLWADSLPEFLVRLLVWVLRLFCDIDNLQVLCKPCHKKKTKKDLENVRAL